MHQITSPVFKEDVKKPQFKNYASVPIVNGNGSGIRDHSPPPKLERITEGSIPISLIADRVVRRSYGEFINLAETLPAMSDVLKKKKMLEYLLETRRQMIKLLVLVKWAKVSKEVNQCIDVVHFLHVQKNCFNNIIMALQHVRQQLSFARLRNPDLRTAIDVLSTGNYPRFPNRLISQFIPARAIAPTEALSTLKSLNTLLHLRLTLHEVIPLPLSKYTIADGKVTFIVPNEWQLSVNISDEFGQWRFVDFKDHSGQDVGDNMRRIVQQVVEDAFERCKIEYGLFPMGVTEESLRSMNKKAPLVEVYNILHRFHLMHSLSSLYVSLHRLSNSARFSPYIQVVSSPNRDSVEFQYWIRAPTTRSQTPRSHPVRLSIVNDDSNLALEEATHSVPGGHIALDYERTKIGVRWTRDGVEVNEQELEGIDLSNAEKLVDHVAKVHAQTILKRIASETEGMTFWEKDELYFLLLDSERRIRISVDLLTGRILLTEASKTSAMLLPSILQQAQHNLSVSLLPPPAPASGQPNRRPPTIKEIIFSSRLLLLKSHISTLAEYKGWATVRYAYGSIHIPDLDVFLPPQFTWEELLFLSIGKETIVLHVLAKQGWLMDLRPLGDGGTLRIIWVSKIPNMKCTDYKADWLEWLGAVRFYVHGRHAIYGFEKGLESRGVEYVVILPPSRAGQTLANQLLLPLLCLKSKNLIPGQSSCWASENIVLRVVRVGENIVAVWEGRVRHSSEIEQLLSSVKTSDPLSYNPKKKLFSLRFPLSEDSTPDVVVSSLVRRFLSVERILHLVQQAKAVQKRSNEVNVFRLEQFNLTGVECVYGVDGPDGELWPVQILVGDHCELIFAPGSPHERFKAFIGGWYNARGCDVGVLAEAYHRFYLQATLPLYRELVTFEVDTPGHPDLETLYNISVLPKSVTSVRLYFPAGPYMLDISLKLLNVEEYAKWMTSNFPKHWNYDKYAVWHILDVALNPGVVAVGDGACKPLPGLQDVWNQCGSLLGPLAHWVVPLGRGMLCDAREGGGALRGIWRCVVDDIGNPSNAEVAAA